MDLFQIAIIIATLLCSLVAGFLFAFAVVTMPGIGRLDDRGFLLGFQTIDGVIQRNQPLFLLVWAGSVVALLAAVVLGFFFPAGVARFLIAGATVAYLLGVQAPTMVINVPLNNRLQALDVAALDDAEAKAARMAFEVRWNRSNVARTVAASLVAVLLLLALQAAASG